MTTSWLHRMSPIPKLAWLVAGVSVALVTYQPVPLLLICGACVGIALSAGIAARLARTLLAFGPLAASILLIQVLVPATCWPTCTPVATAGPLTLYGEGIAHGLALVARLLTMEVVAFTVILTTRAPDLFAALDRLRVPRTLSFAAAMTLQLVPVIVRELRIVLAAQRARGLGTTGLAALSRSLVPVIVASVERIGRLSISLESRGFGGGRPRTSFREVSFTSGDALLAAAGLAAGVLGVIAGIAWWGPDSVGKIVASPAVAVGILVVAAVTFAAMLVRVALFVRRA